MPSHLENPFRPPIPTVVDHEKEAHAIGLLLGPKAEAAYRKRHAHDLSDPSVSVSVGLTAEEQAQMNEKSKETHKSPEQIRAEWGKFLADAGVGESTFHFFLGNEEKFLDSMEIHDDGSVSLTGDVWLEQFKEEPPIFPTKIRELRGSLYLPYLISAEHLILPVTIDRVLALPSLTSAKYLALPKLVRNKILFGKKKLPQSDFDALRASRPDLADKMELK